MKDQIITRIDEKLYGSLLYNSPTYADQIIQGEYCFYADILRTRTPTKFELEEVRKHMVTMIVTMSDYKQGKKSL